jgi:hypothetical protein
VIDVLRIPLPKDRLRTMQQWLKRCDCCEVVFVHYVLEHRTERIGYLYPPGKLNAWYPYPPDLRPPSD